jgi:hypothetical protein
MRIVSVLLTIIILFGIFLIIINRNFDALGSAYEIIAFVIGGASIILAVLDHANASQQDKVIKRLLDKIDYLTDSATAEAKEEHLINKKLSETVDLDEEIINKLSRKPEK